MSLLSSFETFLKTAIMATIPELHFRELLRSWSKSKLLWRAVKLALFPKPSTALKNENPNNSSLEITVTPSVDLQRFEKIRIDAATSCKDREFSMPLREAPIKSSGLSFPQKVQIFSWGNEKSEAFWNYVRNLQSNDLFSIRLRKYSSPCNSLLAFRLFS